MAYLDDLQTRRDAVAAELAAMTSASAGGKPDSSASGVEHVAYKAGLYAELRELDSLITAETDSSDGAWEEMVPFEP